MCDLYVFNKSVKGHLHEMKKIDMEDASEAYADKAGRFYIAAVADGHGDKACMRSAKGSQTAAEIAVECLQELAEDILKVLHEEEPEKETVRDDAFGIGFHGVKEQLEDRILRQYAANIVTKWTEKVENDLEEHKLTKEELQQAGSYEALYRKGERLPHVYGTTLLAALWLDDYLILLQQGDGRCVVFYEDGTVQTSDELGMLDERCHENVTTSLCDTDAAQTMWKHSKVIAMKQKRVMACFLGCDGVEDSYRDMEGLYTFYQNLMCAIDNEKTEDFEGWLEKYLPEFSKNGSGDDISVAGIVDRNRIHPFMQQFQKQVEAYNLSEKLRQLEEKKASMSRKHGLLQERAAEQEKLRKEKEMVNKEFSEVEKEFKDYDEKYQKIQDEIAHVSSQIKKLDSAADASQKPDIPAETELVNVTGEKYPEYQKLNAQKQEPETENQGLKAQNQKLKHKYGDDFVKKNVLIEILTRKALPYSADILLLILVLLLALGVLFCFCNTADAGNCGGQQQIGDDL